MTHKILENAPMRTVIRADLLMKLEILSEEMLDKMKTLEEATVLINSLYMLINGYYGVSEVHQSRSDYL